MTRRLLDVTDEQLGAALASLDLQWPGTPPDLETQVAAGIREASRRPRPPRPAMPHRRKVVLLIAAALLMVAAAATAAKLVIDLGAITIERLPSDGPLPTRTDIPDLGEPVSLEEAQAITGTEPAVPSALGNPDRVWVDNPEDLPDGANDVRIVMAWIADDDLPAIPGSPYGAVLIRWDANVDFGTKLVGGSFRMTTVPGWPRAYWVTGEHELVVYGDDGPTRLLVRGHVLLWGDAQTTFRLETNLSRMDAVEIAASPTA
jgi:hypothetical protein